MNTFHNKGNADMKQQWRPTFPSGCTRLQGGGTYNSDTQAPQKYVYNIWCHTYAWSALVAMAKLGEHCDRISPQV